MNLLDKATSVAHYCVHSVNPFGATTRRPTEGKKEDIQVEIGASNRFVDGFRYLFNIRSNILLINSQINAGNISEEIIEKTKNYLHENGLHDVSISINQYKPQGVWRRIFTNPKTSLLSKLILGIPEGLVATFAIPKLSGIPGDHYSAAQNTIHLFTNDLSVALHECGHAKDFNDRENPMLYSATRLSSMVGNIYPSTLPVLIGSIPTLSQEFIASKNAIEYLQADQHSADRAQNIKNAFKLLVPAFAGYVSQAVSSYISVNQDMFETDAHIIRSFTQQTDPVTLYIQSYMKSMMIVFICVFIGHILGQFIAARVPDDSDITQVTAQMAKLNLQDPVEASDDASPLKEAVSNT